MNTKLSIDLFNKCYYINPFSGQWKSNKKFKCGNSVEYIFPFSVCDGIVDCDDGSDEDNSTTCGCLSIYAKTFITLSPILFYVVNDVFMIK